MLELVDLIPRRPKIKKKEFSEETTCKILVAIFNCSAFVGFPRESKSGLRKKRARWGNPLQNSGYLLQLVELIPHHPDKINIKKSSVGEPLSKFRVLY